MKLISNLLPIIAALAMLPRIQGAKNGISSCTDVSCSVDGPNDTCTLAENTFPSIGVVDAKNIPPILPQVSVVKGVTVTDPVFEDDGLNECITPTGYAISNGYKSVYYLGTPASVDVPSLSRCVVLFHGAHEGLRLFDGHLEESHGVCEDIIDDRCASDLKDLADSASKESQSCSALSRMLTGAHFDTCGNFAGVGRGLGRYTVTDLADLEPITAQQNKTSNSWPIVLKTSNLFHIASDILSGNSIAETLLSELYKITPVVTLLIDRNAGVQSSQPSCVKVVTDMHVEREGMVGDDAGRRSSSDFAMVVAIAAMVFVFQL